MSFPLFIGGCPRSGTTLLVQILNSDPTCFISSEENLLAKSQMLTKAFSTRERRQKVYEEKGERALSERETIGQGILQHNFTAKAVWPLIAEAYQWHHRELHPNAKLQLWGDKTPDYYKNIPELLAIECGRYIHITRNPLDVINSMLRRTEMARQGKDWWKAITAFDAMLDAWVMAYEAVIAHERHPQVFHLIYEELIFDFDTQADRLRSFLDKDLQLINLAVSDRAKHFDRSYLTDHQQEIISAHPCVRQYLRTRENPSRASKTTW